MNQHEKHPRSSQGANLHSTKKAEWKKPQLKQLKISLDTAFFGGSNADGTRGTM